MSNKKHDRRVIKKALKAYRAAYKHETAFLRDEVDAALPLPEPVIPPTGIVLKQVYILRAHHCTCGTPCPIRDPRSGLPAAFESLDDMNDYVAATGALCQKAGDAPNAAPYDTFTGRTIPYTRIALRLAGSRAFHPTTVCRSEEKP